MQLTAGRSRFGSPYQPIDPPTAADTDGGAMESCTLSDFIENMPLGWYHIRLLFITGLGNMADGMEISLILFIGTCAGETWHLTSHEIALICSVVFGGEMVGSLFWGPLADYWGRRPVSLVGLAIITVFGVLSAFAVDFTALLIFQFFVGVGVGSSAVPFDLFAELLPSPHRGTFLVYLQGFFSVGAAFVVCFAWVVLSSWGWRYLVLVTTLPIFLSFVLSLLYLPESPRFLLCEHKDQLARQVVVDAARVNGTPLSPGFELLTSEDVFDDIAAEITVTGKIKKLVTGENAWLTIPLWATWFCFGFGYYGVVVLVVRVFSKNASAVGTPVCDFQYGSILVNSASELITICILLVAIDHGRIKTMASFFCIAGISVALTGFDWVSGSALFYIVLLARIAGTGCNLATWVATSELFPTELRATGHAFATAFLRFGSLMSPFLVESSEVSLLNIGLIISFLFFCGLACSLMLPETKGRKLDVVSLHDEAVSSHEKIAVTTSHMLHPLESFEQLLN